MTPEQLRRSYAVPVLANVPVVQYGEGDFSYQGMRGFAGLGQVTAPAASTHHDLDMGNWITATPYTPYIAAAAVLALLYWWK